jgi:hypothetical protein
METDFTLAGSIILHLIAMVLIFSLVLRPN